jgi:hypothetical protein
MDKTCLIKLKKFTIISKLFSKKFWKTRFCHTKLIEHLKTKQDLIFLLTGLNKNASRLHRQKLQIFTFGKNSEIVTPQNQ